MKNQLEEPIINLTPLIDVVFVILIMFIVIAPLLEADRIELASKKESGSAQQGNGHMQIHVFADNSLTYDAHPITVQQLQACLQNDKARFPTTRPQLYHDKNATFGTYQSIKNIIEESGFTEMDVILQIE